MRYLKSNTTSGIIEFLKNEVLERQADENALFQTNKSGGFDMDDPEDVKKYKVFDSKFKQLHKEVEEAIELLEYEIRNELAGDTKLTRTQQENLWNFFKKQGYGTIAEIEEQYKGVLNAIK